MNDTMLFSWKQHLRQEEPAKVCWIVFVSHVTGAVLMAGAGVLADEIWLGWEGMEKLSKENLHQFSVYVFHPVYRELCVRWKLFY